MAATALGVDGEMNSISGGALRDLRLIAEIPPGWISDLHSTVMDQETVASAKTANLCFKIVQRYFDDNRAVITAITCLTAASSIENTLDVSAGSSSSAISRSSAISLVRIAPTDCDAPFKV